MPSWAYTGIGMIAPFAGIAFMVAFSLAVVSLKEGSVSKDDN